MHDSGQREQFSTGAVRDAAPEKPRIDLISPFALIREGEWMRLGLEKYPLRNWESGIPFHRMIAAIYRHLLAYEMGDTSEDHLAAIRTNSAFIMHFEELIKRGMLTPELDDRVKYKEKSDGK